MSDYPRVLIVNGEPISASTATGMTLSSLFAGWPDGNLAQIFTSPLPHTRRVAFEHRLTVGERRGLSGLPAWMNGRRASPREEGAAAPPMTAREVTQRERSAFRPMMRTWLDLVPFELPEDVEKLIVSFRPEVVYSLLGSIQLSRMASRCASLCGVSLVPDFRDDWMSTLYAGRADLVLQRRYLLRELRNVLGAAPFGMAGSDRMAEEYGATYGMPFHSFMFCLSVPAAITLPPAIRQGEGPRLVYVGGLHLNRWISLKKIAAALARLNAEGIPGKLFVYAPPGDVEAYKERLSGPGCEVAGSLTLAEVGGALAGGHVLVHVESFAPEDRAYTRLSMSTKMSQYMSAGRPVLCFGPGEVASCRFVAENEFGVVAGSEQDGSLDEALRTILGSAELRARLGENAWAVARRRFDAVSVQEQFRAALAEAAWGAGKAERT